MAVSEAVRIKMARKIQQPKLAPEIGLDFKFSGGFY